MQHNIGDAQWCWEHVYAGFATAEEAWRVLVGLLAQEGFLFGRVYGGEWDETDRFGTVTHRSAWRVQAVEEDGGPVCNLPDVNRRVLLPSTVASANFDASIEHPRRWYTRANIPARTPACVGQK